MASVGRETVPSITERCGSWGKGLSLLPGVRTEGTAELLPFEDAADAGPTELAGVDAGADNAPEEFNPCGGYDAIVLGGSTELDGYRE